MAPFPSVPKDQLCGLLISAIVVEEFGMAPYWLSSRMFMTAGFTKPSMTNSSATLEIRGSGISVSIPFGCQPLVSVFTCIIIIIIVTITIIFIFSLFRVGLVTRTPNYPTRPGLNTLSLKLIKVLSCSLETDSMPLILITLLSLFFHRIFLFGLVCF